MENCFIILRNAIANELDHHAGVMIDMSVIKTIENACAELDIIADENDCCLITASADSKTGDCSVTLAAQTFEFECGGADNILADAIRHAKAFQFLNKNDQVYFTLTYGGVFLE